MKNLVLTVIAVFVLLVLSNTSFAQDNTTSMDLGVISFPLIVAANCKLSGVKSHRETLWLSLPTPFM